MGAKAPKVIPVTAIGTSLGVELIDQSSSQHEPRQLRRHDYTDVLTKLGTCPDQQLADQVGCDKSLIAKLRHSFDIPKHDRIQRVLHLLGRMSDRELCRRTGISAVTIGRRRRALGIPALSAEQSAGRTTLERYLTQLKQTLES